MNAVRPLLLRPSATDRDTRSARVIRESTHPRDDVRTLTARVDELTDAVRELRARTSQNQQDTDDDLRRARADVVHVRTQMTADLKRVEDAQAADRGAARAGDDDLRRTIDQMVRRVDATLDGVSDHQELLTGLRALVRMIRSE